MNARGLIAGARNNAFVQKKVPAVCSGTRWPLLLGPIDQENNDADWRFACLGLEPGPFQTPRSGTAPGCGSHALQSWNSLKKIRKQWIAVTRALEPYGRSGADEVWSRSARVGRNRFIAPISPAPRSLVIGQSRSRRFCCTATCCLLITEKEQAAICCSANGRAFSQAASRTWTIPHAEPDTVSAQRAPISSKRPEQFPVRAQLFSFIFLNPLSCPIVSSTFVARVGPRREAPSDDSSAKCGNTGPGLRRFAPPSRLRSLTPCRRLKYYAATRRRLCAFRVKFFERDAPVRENLEPSAD